MNLLEIVGIIALVVGTVALLNWLGGEKHLLFNNWRKTTRLFKKRIK